MNRRALFAFFVCGIAFAADPPELTITPADAAKHVGKIVTVKGPVSGVKEMKSGLILINMGAKPHPNQEFTAVIQPENAQKVKEYLPDLSGDVISVTGQVTLHKEKPQIVVTEARQVNVEK